MEKETIDRMTAIGLGIFFGLGVVYLCRDTISNIHVNVSLNPPSAGLELPVINLADFLNFDWFYNMDPASKIVFVFVMMILLGTLVGSALLYMRYRRRNAQR